MEPLPMARKKKKKTDNRVEIMRLLDAGYHLTTKQTAVFLGLTERTLETYRDIGKSPRFIKIAHHVRYPKSFLDEYLRSATQDCAAACHADIPVHHPIEVECTHAETDQEIY
jgi:hypothetical protein